MCGGQRPGEASQVVVAVVHVGADSDPAPAAGQSDPPPSEVAGEGLGVDPGLLQGDDPGEVLGTSRPENLPSGGTGQLADGLGPLQDRPRDDVGADLVE